jgi:YqaJ-like viral recombinase domain
MKIHDVEQNSVDWQILRSGKVTASEMDSLVTPLGRVKTGDGPRTYLMKKVAEMWLGGPLPSLNVWDMEQGQILEEWARPAFTLETGLEVQQVGFITSDDGRVGCSPDGLVGTDCGLEIKCPHVETHIRYLLDGVVPPDYVIQVQASLFVTRFPKWIFYSYRRRMPPLMLEVAPDPKIQDAIRASLEWFIPELDKAMARLAEINGGFPERKPIVPRLEPEPEGITP